MDVAEFKFNTFEHVAQGFHSSCSFLSLIINSGASSLPLGSSLWLTGDVQETLHIIVNLKWYDCITVYALFLEYK